MSETIRCRHCGREIIFIRTRKGAYMPCNPAPEWFWADPAGPVLVYQMDGSCQKARLSGLEGTQTGSGYVPHWPYCTARHKADKPKPRKETEIERVWRERAEREREKRAEREAKAAERAEAEKLRREAEAAQINLFDL